MPTSRSNPSNQVPRTPRFIGALIAVWMMFVSWLGGPSRTMERIDHMRWLLAGRPTLHLQLGQQGRNPSIRKYEVSVRLPDYAPVLMEFGATDPLMRTLSMALPSHLLDVSLPMEVQIAAVDDKGCILEGGEQQFDAKPSHQTTIAAHGVLSPLGQVIRIDMKTLPRALCVL